MYGLDFDQWLMSVSQSVYAAGYFIHIKKLFFLTFRLTELIWTRRPRRFSETKTKLPVKKVVFFFVEPARNDFAPP
jgi:hypothetical protein